MAHHTARTLAVRPSVTLLHRALHRALSLAAMSLALSATLPAKAQPQTPAAAATPASFEGRWITESGNLEVEIAPCGTAWCGTVIRVLGNRSMRRDGEEMAPADARPALGMALLNGLAPVADADRATLAGEIYNRENAKTYRVRLTLDSPRHLAVRAYVGLPLFGQTQHWQRSTAP